MRKQFTAEELEARLEKLREEKEKKHFGECYEGQFDTEQYMYTPAK